MAIRDHNPARVASQKADFWLGMTARLAVTPSYSTGTRGNGQQLPRNIPPADGRRATCRGEPLTDGGIPHISDVRNMVCDFNHCVHLAPRSIMSDRVFLSHGGRARKKSC